MLELDRVIYLMSVLVAAHEGSFFFILSFFYVNYTYCTIHISYIKVLKNDNTEKNVINASVCNRGNRSSVSPIL